MYREWCPFDGGFVKSRQRADENVFKKCGGSGVGTRDSLPRAHMLAHQGTMERSNADSDRCINSVLVNVLTQSQGGAILPMEGTKLQERTSGYTGAGCSAIDPTTHKPTIRRLIQPGTDKTNCRKHDPTVKRPQASGPTPNPPGMQGSTQERRPMGWQHHDAPRPPATMPTNAPQRQKSTIKQPTNRPQRPTSNPQPQDHNVSP